MYMFDNESRELSRNILVFISRYVCPYNEILTEHVSCITRNLIKMKRTLSPCMAEILAIRRKTLSRQATLLSSY